MIEKLKEALEALRTKVKTLTDEARAITAKADEEKRDRLNEAEDARFTEIETELAGLDEEIAETERSIERLEALEQRHQEQATKLPDFQQGRKADDADTIDRDVFTMRPTELRSAALATLERKDVLGLAPDQKDKVEKLLRSQTRHCNGAVIAQRMLITENEHYRSAWAKIMTQSPPILSVEEQRAIEAWYEFRTAGSIGVDTAGGFGVPVLIDPSIILTGQGSLNPFRRLATVKTITTDAWRGVSSAGVTASYDAELTEVSDDSPTLAQPSIPAHKGQAWIGFSIELGSDYPGFASEMATLLAEGFDEVDAEMFAKGTGSDQPTGILTALDANTNVEVVVTTDGAFGAVDVRKAWTALPDRARPNATWVMSEDVKDVVSSFGTSWGADSTATLAENTDNIKSRPTVVSSYFPEFTGVTTAANILVVGDFSRFYIVDRAGTNVELVPHRLATANNLPKGERGWYAWKRTGSDSVDDTRFRLLQNQ